MLRQVSLCSSDSATMTSSSSSIFTKPRLSLHPLEGWDSRQGELGSIISSSSSSSVEEDEMIVVVLGGDDQDQPFQREHLVERVGDLVRNHQWTIQQEWFRGDDGGGEEGGRRSFYSTAGSSNTVLLTNVPGRLSRLRGHRVHSVHVIGLPRASREAANHFLAELGTASKTVQMGQRDKQIAVNIYVDPSAAITARLLVQWMEENALEEAIPAWLLTSSSSTSVEIGEGGQLLVTVRRGEDDDDDEGGEDEEDSEREERRLTLATYLSGKGFGQGICAAACQVWRLASHDERSLRDLVLSQAGLPVTRRAVTDILAREMSRVSRRELPPSIDFNVILEETANFILELLQVQQEDQYRRVPLYEKPPAAVNRRQHYRHSHRRTPHSRTSRWPRTSSQDVRPYQRNERPSSHVKAEGGWSSHPPRIPPAPKPPILRDNIYNRGNQQPESHPAPTLSLTSASAPLLGEIDLPLPVRAYGPPAPQLQQHQQPRRPLQQDSRWTLDETDMYNGHVGYSSASGRMGQWQNEECIEAGREKDLNVSQAAPTWDSFEQFLRRKLSTSNGGGSSSDMSPVTTVIKRLMVHSGLNSGELQRQYRSQGLEFVQRCVKESLIPFSNCLRVGITADVIVTLVSEFVALA